MSRSRGAETTVTQDTCQPDAAAFDSVVAATKAIPKDKRFDAKEAWFAELGRNKKLRGMPLAVAQLLAKHLFWEKGYTENLSVTEIAIELNCSRRSIQYAIAKLGGEVERRADWRVVGKLSDKAKTAFPGIVRAYEQLAAKGGSEKNCTRCNGLHGGSETDCTAAVKQIAPPQCNRGSPSQSPVLPPDRSPDLSPGGTEAIFSNGFDRGLTGAAVSAAARNAGPQLLGGLVASVITANAPAESAPKSGPPEALTLAWLQANWPDLPDKARAHGHEPQVVLDRIASRSASRLRRGKGPLRITESFHGYFLKTSENIRNDRLAKDRDPSALVAARAALSARAGGDWKPNGSFRRR